MLPIVGFKMSIDLYVLYFFLCIDHNAPEIMSTIALIMLIIGLVLLIISILRIIQSAKAGTFRRDGKGLFKNQNNTSLWFYVGGVSVIAILRRLCVCIYFWNSKDNNRRFLMLFESEF
ncbi:hypothetical protein MHH81_20580 [Psychrobacillus sp. FSL H8-0484]|uniref:hypothetical protein n=1 Tax=Psychrobacillus sp. FSL H8-0484 TaxID=2921390 RepID=UPI0030FBD2A9